MLQIPDQKVPLVADEEGVLHVAGTRVTLECVAEMFEGGASPEEIADEYDSLELADVYAVVTYFLRSPSEVKTYLSEQTEISTSAAKRADDLFPRGLREKLIRARDERG